jgi:hypothetical protein
MADVPSDPAYRDAGHGQPYPPVDRKGSETSEHKYEKSGGKRTGIVDYGIL